MKRMNKLLVVTFAVFSLFAFNGFSQQITKFAVVDTSKIYTAFYKNSDAVRNYETKKAEFQAEIKRRTDELRTLRQKKLEYDRQGNSTDALKVQAEITKKTEYLTEYTNAKNIELEAMLSQMQRSDDFYKKLYKTLAKVAESGGYSMILSLQESNSILWYSPSVDVTEEVIKELGY